MRLRRIRPCDATERMLIDLLRGAEPPAEAPAWRDWQRIRDLAHQHRIGGNLYWRHHGAAWWRRLPQPLRRAWRELYRQTVLRNASLERELVTVLDALAPEGIVPVLLKGPALGMTVFRDLGARAYADIDLLIVPEELPTARRVMRDLGFVIDETSQSESFYRRHHFHLIFRRPDQPWSRFEIHWDLTIPYMDTTLDVGELRARAVPHAVDGRPLLLLSPEDLLLHLSLHTSLGVFSYLSQVADIHAVIEHPDWELDADEIWARARRYRVQTAVAACLELARLWGDTPRLERLREGGPTRLPGHLRPLVRTETIVRQRLLYSAAGGRAASLARRDRRRDRAAFLLRQIFPSAADLGLDGHPLQGGADSSRRRFSWRGLVLASRILIFKALARCGWEMPDPNDVRSAARSAPDGVGP